MSDLNQIFKELANELSANSVFYLPLSILDIEEFKNLPEDCVKILDRIAYIDDHMNLVYDNNLSLTALITKSSKLRTNCFKLLEYKEILSQSSYNYLSEHYLKQVQTYTIFSNQLVLYFERNSPLKDESTKTMFNLQDLNFNTHLAEVKKITSVSGQILNPQNIIQEVKQTPIYKRLAVDLMPKEMYFRDFINHERKNDIESSILKKYPTINGKKLRYIIEFLVKKEVITIIYGTQIKLFEALERTFNCNIGGYSSIFGYKVNEVKNSDYSRITRELETTLNEFF